MKSVCRYENMNVVAEKKGIYVLRFEKGEKYPDVFIQFLKKKKIRGGFFTGIGAGVNPEISIYNLKRKKYTIIRKFLFTI